MKFLFRVCKFKIKFEFLKEISGFASLFNCVPRRSWFDTLANESRKRKNWNSVIFCAIRVKISVIHCSINHNRKFCDLLLKIEEDLFSFQPMSFACFEFHK